MHLGLAGALGVFNWGFIPGAECVFKDISNLQQN